MAKKTDEKKLKKITFKFNPKDGGSVTLKGLGEPDGANGEFEDAPKELQKVLEDYGFDQDGDDYRDILAPGDGMSVDEDIEAIAGVVPLAVVSKLLKKKVGCTVLWECSLDDGDVTKPEKDLLTALQKAHALWNKNGRHIDGVTLEEALRRVLDKINAKRG